LVSQEPLFSRFISVDGRTKLKELLNLKIMAPTKQKAVSITQTGPKFGLADVPKPGPGQILVKVVAAAQNPADCQYTFSHAWGTLSSSLGKSLELDLKASQYGGIVGYDFAGMVEELGPDVPAGVRSVGERVGGCRPRNKPPANGAFAEYVRCRI